MSATRPYDDDRKQLIVKVELATAIGLEPSIVLRRIDQWLYINEQSERLNVYRLGLWWTFGTYQAYRERDFPMMSERSVKRCIADLEALGLLYSTTTFNQFPIDNTKWYTVDAEAYSRFMALWEEHGSPWSESRHPEEKARYQAFLKAWAQERSHAPTPVARLMKTLRENPEALNDSESPSGQIGTTRRANLERPLQGLKKERERKDQFAPSATAQTSHSDGARTPRRISRNGTPQPAEAAEADRITGAEFDADPLAPLLCAMTTRKRRYILKTELQKLKQESITYFDRTLHTHVTLPGPYQTIGGIYAEEFKIFLQRLGDSMKAQRGRPPAMSELVTAVVDYGRVGGWGDYVRNNNAYIGLELPPAQIVTQSTLPTPQPRSFVQAKSS